MRLHPSRVFIILFSLLASTSLRAQEPPVPAVTALPRLVRVTSSFVPANHMPPGPMETVTLSIYADETGGTPLWQETQYVALDTNGRYTLLLGATAPEGLPHGLFASGEARWLGQRFERAGETEQARVLLASVPYALKASDADTLGGLPSSAYLLADADAGGGANTNGGTKHRKVADTTSPSDAQALTAGNAGFIGKFVNGTDLGNSAAYDAGGLVGINTTAPLDAMHVRFTNTGGTMTGLAVQNLGNTATSYSGMLFYDQTGALGQFQGFNNSTHEYRINNIASGGTINFMVNSISRFRVRNDGDIEIAGGVRKGGVRVLHNFGTENTFLGASAGNQTLSGGYNSAIGASALVSNTSGTDNTASGAMALASNTAGSYNTASGGSALYSNTTGASDTANGFDALLNNTTGSSNTATGYGALSSNTAGNSNVAVGYLAGLNATTGTNNIYVGANVQGVAGESNTMYLGRPGFQTRAFMGGVRGVTTGVADAIPVVIDSNGQLGTISSSRRFKEDIRDMGDASRALLALRPVTFRYAQPYSDGAKPIQYGLVAEEVAEVFPDLAVRNAEGGVDTVHYETLSVLLLNEVQQQQRRIEVLEQRLNALLAK